MLILAGVTIHFTLGENGILKNAELAGNKYKESSENETNMLDKAYAYMNGEEKLQPNTPETLAGTPVQIPNDWYIETTNIYSLTEQKNVKEGKKVASVYAVSDGQNNTIPIPKGFYYVGGNLSSGVVISDSEQDKDKYKNAEGGIVPSGLKVIEVEENGTKVKKLESELKGNQFVWIPCKEGEYHKTNWGQGNTNYSNGYWEVDSDSYELNQIAKYGGYYVGRYEASLPDGTQERTENTAVLSDVYNFYGIPQSKAGKIPWNYIDYNMSQKNAMTMYENNESVSSGLITGTQWDVMLNKIASTDNTKSLTDSKLWGNYIDSDNFTYKGRRAEVISELNVFESVVENGEKPNNKSYVLTTGASEHNRAYNIYDVAGNLSEWTEESSTNTSSAETLTQYKDIRGGNCGISGSSGGWMVCYRACLGDKSMCAYFNGFRVVLYIK